MLRRAARVLVSAGIDKDEFRSKGFAQALGVMPRHRQPAAFLGAIERESAV